MLKLIDPQRHTAKTVKSKFELALEVYKPKIDTFAKNNIAKFPGVSLEDLTQEISLVLWKCIEFYDPNKSAGFSTIFWTCAKNRMVDMIARVNRDKRTSEWFVLPSSIDLDEDALAIVIDHYVSEPSAEDWTIIHENILERWNALPVDKRISLIS